MLGLIPAGEPKADTGQTPITLNYTVVLNILLGIVAVMMVVRFLRSGGRTMLSMTGGEPSGEPDQLPS